MMLVIVDAMLEYDFKRIACIATAGIHGEIPRIFTKLIISLIYKHVIRDNKGAAEYIMNHDLDYTIARPLSLINGEMKMDYRTSLDGIPKAVEIYREVIWLISW